jgi:hypothetical protein
MADIVLGPRVLDFGLSELNTRCNQIWACSAQPVDYADAVSKKLGAKDFGAPGSAFGTILNASAGRQVASLPVTDGQITANGTAAAWAAVSSTDLLATGAMLSSRTVYIGQSFKLPALTLQMLRAGVVTSEIAQRDGQIIAQRDGQTITNARP